MSHVKKSTTIDYSAKQMFDLVADVEQYPIFLPWCGQTKILEKNTDGITAEVGIALGRLSHSFTTRNQHIGNKKIIMRLVKGPFSRLYGEWTFDPLENNKCLVCVDISFGFDNLALSLLIGPAFSKITGSLIDSFVKRAHQIYK